MPATKSSRLAVRLSSDQDALIREAADLQGTTITDFTVQAAVVHAQDVLADRRLFDLGEEAWEAFTHLLERPVVAKPRLAALLAEDTVFE